VYEFFEHTADLGLRVRAATLDDLFRDAAVGLMAMFVEDVPPAAAATERELSVPGERLDWLLFDWLRELLWIVESEGLVMRDVDVHVDQAGGGVRARFLTVPLDFDVHVPLHEVKAITYHGLRVEHTADGWLAEVIVDI
jgi:SHS2 domain-containing protein